jgi:hypothetical protein
MTSLLTPTKSKVDHANTSLFLSRKLGSFACSSWLATAPMHTVLSETLGPSGTFLNLPSASMIFCILLEVLLCVGLTALVETIHFSGLT